MQQFTIIATVALGLLNTALALPRPPNAPAPSRPSGLPTKPGPRPGPGPTDCTLDKLIVPFALTTPPLVAPDAALTLSSIVIGRGVQNYTCPAPGSNATAPTANGAIAILYDASCFASPATLLANLATAALPLPLPSDPLAPLLLKSNSQGGPGNGKGKEGVAPAHRSIITSMLPRRPCLTSLNTPARAMRGMGVGRMKVDGKSNAPVDAGANVPWLALGPAAAPAGEENGQRIRAIYRVETRGGVVAAADCEGKGEGDVVSVEYAAAYWAFVAGA